MSINKICITFTGEEYEFLGKRGLLKEKTLYKLIQGDINKIFGGVVIPGGLECESGKSKVKKTFDIHPRLWPAIICISKKLRLSPSQLIYRVVVAPYLVEIATEGRLVAEIKIPD